MLSIFLSGGSWEEVIPGGPGPGISRDAGMPSKNSRDEECLQSIDFIFLPYFSLSCFFSRGCVFCKLMIRAIKIQQFWLVWYKRHYVISGHPQTRNLLDFLYRNANRRTQLLSGIAFITRMMPDVKLAPCWAS